MRKCQHAWMTYLREQYCIYCKHSRRNFRFFVTLKKLALSGVISTTLLLAPLSTAQYQEPPHRMRWLKMFLVAANFQDIGIAGHYTTLIENAAIKYGLDPILLLALFITESELRHSATSSKGYKGIAQTPQRGTPSWNINEGARILREKMHIAKWHTERAISLYKGYGGLTNANTARVLQLAKIAARNGGSTDAKRRRH